MVLGGMLCAAFSRQRGHTNVFCSPRLPQLHRALHDERANSTQLEERLAEQQAQLRALTDANAQLSAAEGASASDAEAAAAAAAAAEQAQRELAQARAQAERYAAAAENLSSELGAARQEADAAAAQLAAVQEAAAVQLAAGQEAAADEAAAAQEGNFSLIADYKQQLDEAREALEAQVRACMNNDKLLHSQPV